MKPLSECRLYAFVDTAYLNGRAATTIAQQLCDGGADLIQLRAKQSTSGEVHRLAESILPITRRSGVGLVINDHPEIARQVGAELCHLGQEDFFGAGHTEVRQLTATNHQLQVGLSTHNPEQAWKAIKARPHYIAIGPVYATATKPQAQPVTLDYVRWAAANVDIPWFAIGGITLANVNEVLEAGAQRICIVSAILNRADLTTACQDFRKKLDGS